MLLDTDVLIDIGRRHPAAVEWLAGLSNEPVVPGFAAMEMVSGCRNAVEQNRTTRLLQQFARVWPDEVSLDRASAQYTAARLSARIGLIDTLIAATAVSRGLPLATFNDRHYRGIPGLVTVQPYTR
jgi:hypothetical protein